MPLIALWKSDPKTVAEFTIQQIVAFAGNGKLTDGSTCSEELRTYISEVSSSKLGEYVKFCLDNSFDKSGLVLQDLINELGRRLEFNVEFGLYSGRRNQIGNDGLWQAPEGSHVVLEVKTTDAYRMSMDTLAGYRSKLITEGQITENSSILIVVGRDDTGELEAQVRGSRHAWDIRLVSAESLVKMVILKEEADEPETGRKIRQILVPVEYTRVDQLVDVVFSTAADLKDDEEDRLNVVDTDENSGETTVSARDDVMRRVDLERQAVLMAISKAHKVNLIKRSRAMYWTSDKSFRLACTVSKRYEDGPGYWYAFHPRWKEFLTDCDTGYLVLGVMGRDDLVVLPISFFLQFIDKLNTTGKGEKMYWHIHLNEMPNRELFLVVPKETNVSVDRFLLPKTE